MRLPRRRPAVAGGRFPVPVGDAVLGLATLLVAAVEWTFVINFGPSASYLLNGLIHTGLAVAITLRRLRPRASFIAVYTLLAALAALIRLTPVNLGVSPVALLAPFTLYTVARRLPTPWGIVALALGIVGSFGSPLTRFGGSTSIWVMLHTLVLVLVYLWGTDRRRGELRMAAEVIRAQSDERLRIARELHDIVGHSLAVVQVQASTALAVGGEQLQRDALTAIRDASADALNETRALVGVLRSPAGESHEPTGDLTTIEKLVVAARAAGARVDTDLPAVDDLARFQQTWPAATRLTVVRVLQEGLTNVLKHGGRAPTARVWLLHDEHTIRVGVENDHAPPATGTPGNGLIGVRERVQLVGGTLDARRTDTGFLLAAELPVPKEAP